LGIALLSPFRRTRHCLAFQAQQHRQPRPREWRLKESYPLADFSGVISPTPVSDQLRIGRLTSTTIGWLSGGLLFSTTKGQFMRRPVLAKSDSAFVTPSVRSKSIRLVNRQICYTARWTELVASQIDPGVLQRRHSCLARSTSRGRKTVLIADSGASALFSGNMNPSGQTIGSALRTRRNCPPSRHAACNPQRRIRPLP